MSVLDEIGFDGYIGLETYNSSLGDFAFQRGMFHNVCPDGGVCPQGDQLSEDVDVVSGKGVGISGFLMSLGRASESPMCVTS